MKSLFLTLMLTCSMLMPTVEEGVIKKTRVIGGETPIVVEETAPEMVVEPEESASEKEDLEAPPAVPRDEDFQIALEDLGYLRQEYGKEIDIRNGILRFQSQHNLVVDGIFGHQSNTALRKLLGEEAYAYPDVVEEAPSIGYWITINKTKRILTLYKGKAVIKKYPVAQGKSQSLTPEGKFTIVSKIVNPYWGGAGVAKPVPGGSPKNPLGYRWLGISYGGGSRYGIHGNNSPLSIGTNASLGCVRMINADVEELFEMIPLSTIVWIGSDDKLQEWGIRQESYLMQSPRLEAAILPN